MTLCILQKKNLNCEVETIKVIIKTVNTSIVLWIKPEETLKLNPTQLDRTIFKNIWNKISTFKTNSSIITYIQLYIIQNDKTSFHSVLWVCSSMDTGETLKSISMYAKVGTNIICDKRGLKKRVKLTYHILSNCGWRQRD